MARFGNPTPDDPLGDDEVDFGALRILLVRLAVERLLGRAVVDGETVDLDVERWRRRPDDAVETFLRREVDG